MKLSRFGQLMAQSSPIVELMEDLGQALNDNPDMLFLGGGNPAQVPAAQALFSRHLASLQANPELQKSVLGVYQSPQGNSTTLAAVADYLNAECGWEVTPANIAMVSGSQTAFFILLNLFAGDIDERKQKILLPLVPEYLGYGSQGLSEGLFVPMRPHVQKTADNRFKYTIDFDALVIDDSIGAICVSRPTNPSGNLITDMEMTRLADLARQHDIPLITDLAYGSPFPGVVYRDCKPTWAPGQVTVMSLSKLGLPGLRTAVVVADEAVIRAVSQANTIISLAGGNLGPFMLERMIESGDLQRLSHQLLPDFYRRQRDILVNLLDTHLQGLPYRLHEPEGAFFLWLWFERLPVSSRVLYERLKEKGVLVMAGEPFFFGLDQHWTHARECLRLTYCQAPEVLAQAASILAHEVRTLYEKG